MNISTLRYFYKNIDRFKPVDAEGSTVYTLSDNACDVYTDSHPNEHSHLSSLISGLLRRRVKNAVFVILHNKVIQLTP